MSRSELTPDYHKGTVGVPSGSGGRRMAEGGRCYVPSPAYCAPRCLAFRTGWVPRSDRIIKEGCNESYYLEADSVGGCNRHSVGGNEHTDQRAGTTAAKHEKTAGQKKAARHKKAARPKQAAATAGPATAAGAKPATATAGSAATTGPATAAGTKPAAATAGSAAAGSKQAAAGGASLTTASTATH